MAFRIRVALGIALLVSLVVAITASAKGGFNFITISGPGLNEPLRVTDPALTEDFFTFANFYEHKTKAPAHSGEGYEILRYYVDGKREIVFDRLHYYPETGFVFYDGIENGESEYDGDWYTAKPEIKTIFESALSAQTQSIAPLDKQAVTSREPTKPNEFLSGSMVLAIIASLAMILVLAFWLRKSPVDSPINQISKEGRSHRPSLDLIKLLRYIYANQSRSFLWTLPPRMDSGLICTNQALPPLTLISQSSAFPTTELPAPEKGPRWAPIGSASGPPI